MSDTPTTPTKARTKKPADGAKVDARRAALAKATETEQAAKKALADARRAVKKAGRDLLAALAGDLDLTAAERRAMGLAKGGR